MTTTTAIAIYFLIWWLALFAVLPWGVRAQGEEGAPGTDPGAPRIHNVAMKLLYTTLVASVVFAVLAFIYIKRIVTIDDLARLLGTPF